MTASNLGKGESAVIAALECSEKLRRKFLNMGFIPEEKITLLFKAPCGGPAVFYVGKRYIAVRLSEAESIKCE